MREDLGSECGEGGESGDSRGNRGSHGDHEYFYYWMETVTYAREEWIV